MRGRGAKHCIKAAVVAGVLLYICASLPIAAQTTTTSPAAGTSGAAVKQPPADVDWSKAVVESTMRRYPNPADLGTWGYAKSLYLFGEYLVWKRTGDNRYLQYVKGWVDSHVDAQGNIDHKINSLDDMLAGNLLLILYQETREEKYKLAAQKIRERFNNYPRTADGGFWHADSKSREHQLWLDGVFMSMPFLVRYGRLFGESAYTNDEAAKQLVVYAGHLHDSSTGLLYHAYDESGASTWANPETHHSAEFWARAMGWFGMTLVEVLEVLPADHPQRPKLIATLQELVRGLVKYQDSKTGLWYEVVNRGDAPDNWLETSSSSMYSYIISMAVRRGYVDKKYDAVAKKGYRGVLTKVSLDPEGLANISDICEGTNVGDAAFYFARKRNGNDFHGLGAFLIMNEHFLTSRSMMELTAPPSKAVSVAVANPTNTSRVEDVVLSVSEIQRTHPDFRAQSLVVSVQADNATGKETSPGGNELPSQLDDLDGDGQPDEIAFQIALQPKQTRVVTVAYDLPESAQTKKAEYPRRTDAKFAKHYDGMGWESETTAWRLYFDKRNAIDLWGKRKPGLYLQTFSADGYKYQEEAPIGRDIYNVGHSLGAGGVGALLDGKAVAVSDVTDRKWRIISTGPVRSIVEFTYKGWTLGGHSTDLTSRITQWAGERGYEHRISVSNPDGLTLVTGLSRKPALQEITGDSSCSLAIWGHQVVRPGTGATESLPSENLGLAVLVPQSGKDCQVSGDPANYLVRPALNNGAARWYVLAAWDQEPKAIRNAAEFKTVVQQEEARLSQPATISILADGMQTASAGSQSSTTASESVKFFSADEVHAALAKGAPLLQKDGHNFWITAGRRDKPGQAELHIKDRDVIYVIQGTATFVTGGTIVDPKTTAPDEVRGASIQGGETHTLAKDDVIVIPAGVPHWFKEVQGEFLYFVVKVEKP